MAAIANNAPRSAKCLTAAAPAAPATSSSLGRPPALWQRQLCSARRIGCAAASSTQLRVRFQKRRRTFSSVSTNALAEEDLDTQKTGSDPISDVTNLPDTDIAASIASRLQLIEEDFQSQPASCVVCLVPGGPVEQVYFFPVLAALKKKYPSAAIDVVASSAAINTYALCPFVRNTIAYEMEDNPIKSSLTTADFQDILGKIKYQGYDVIVSAKPAGLVHGLFLFLTSIDKKFGIYARFNAAGAYPFLQTTAKAKAENLADVGMTMYDDLARAILEDGDSTGITLPSLSECGLSVPEKALPSLTPQERKTVVIHGVISSSKGSMVAQGKGAEMLTPEIVFDIAKKVVAEGGRAVVAVPYLADLKGMEVEENIEVVECLTPLSLAAQIIVAKAVIAAPTIALPIAEALGKPSVCVAKSVEPAETFAPFATPLLLDDLIQE